MNPRIAIRAGLHAAAEAIEAFADGELAPDARAWLLVHFQVCAACALAVERVVAWKQRLRSAAAGLQSPPWLETRIRARLAG